MQAHEIVPATNFSFDLLFSRILTFLLTFKNTDLYLFLKDSADFLLFFSVFFSLTFLITTIVVAFKHEQAELELIEKISTPPAEVATPQVNHNKEWDRVLDLANSQNPNDWRLAILEADILLDEMLTMNGGVGDTIGDKLKSFDQAAFPSIQMAWDAHLVRNQIAHEGANFILTDREARRVIALYESVLRAGLYIR